MDPSPVDRPPRLDLKSVGRSATDWIVDLADLYRSSLIRACPPNVVVPSRFPEWSLRYALGLSTCRVSITPPALESGGLGTRNDPAQPSSLDAARAT